jgi:FtsH-binding integral membrane protein
MKTITLVIYLSIINAFWIFLFLASLAGGHGISLKNPETIQLFIMSGIIILNSFFLIKYHKRYVGKNISVFFLMTTLIVFAVLIFKLISIGSDSYIDNIHFFMLLGLAIFFTLLILKKILVSKTPNTF